MRHSILLTAFLFSHRSSATAQPPTVLQCRVDLLDGTGSPLVARTGTAKQFQSFPLDLAKDPDVAWGHQNLCVGKADYRQARFPGALSLVLITTRAPAAADGGPALSLDLGLQPQAASGPGGGSLPAAADSTEATIPVDQAGRKLSCQHFFSGDAARSLRAVKLNCRR